MNSHSHSRALVLGDVMLDRYTRGGVRRVSPEAPVLILDAEHEEARLGGAAAGATLLAGLGVAPLVAGVVGADSAGGVVMDLVARLEPRCEASSPGVLADKETEGQGDKGNPAGDTAASSPCPLVCLSRCRRKSRGGVVIKQSGTHQPALIQAPTRQTTVKRRFISQPIGQRGQQLLRVDRESRRPLAGELEDELLAAALATLDNAQAILISDYGKGVCTPKIVATMISAARRRRLPVLIDPRRGADYSLYRFATVIKPNRREAGEALGHEIRTRCDAFAAGRELCRRWNFQAAVITLDTDGLVLVTADGGETHFAARQSHVADVTGAGDTVLAVLGAALLRGTSLAEACSLATVAAGLQVERCGVAPVWWHEIARGAGSLTALDDKETRGHRDKGNLAESDVSPSPCRLVSLSPCPPEGREIQPQSQGQPNHSRPIPLSPCPPISLDALLNEITLHRAHGRRITFTNGCFDLLHAGHLHCLTAAKAMGDVLIVAINSDASVRRLKGESRPIVRQHDRAALLAALTCVDYVTIFDDDTPERLIAALRPDVLIKGAEDYPADIPGEAMVRSYGGRVELIPLLPGYSTTELLSPKSKVQSLKSKVQGPRSKVQGPRSKVQSPKSKVQGPRSKVQSPRSKVQSPKSKVQGPRSRPEP